MAKGKMEISQAWQDPFMFTPSVSPIYLEIHGEKGT